MIDPSVLVGFALVSLVLNVTPGPDMLYAVSRSATQGWRGAIGAATGNLLGSLVHTIFVVAGLSALLVASSTAFTIVKIAGAAYLVYLGVRAIMARRASTDQPRRPKAGMARIIRESFVIHTLNPKTAVFFLAFLPQFISPDRHATSQLVVLGLWFTLQAALVLALVGLMAARLGARWRLSERAAIWLHRGVGAIFVALGVRLALSR